MKNCIPALYILSLILFLSCSKEDITLDEIEVPKGDFVKLYDKTKIVSPEMNPSMIDSLVMRVDSNFGEAQDIEPGIVLVGGVSSDFPSGFLRKVVSLESDGGGMILTTEKASMDEAFEEYSLTYNFQGLQRSFEFCDDLDDIEVGFLSFEEMQVCITGEFISEKIKENGVTKYRMGFNDFNLPVEGSIVASNSVSTSKSPETVIAPSKQIAFLIPGPVIPIPVIIDLELDIRFGYTAELGGHAQLDYGTNLLSGDHLVEISDEGDVTFINNPPDDVAKLEDRLELTAVVDGAVKLILEIEAKGSVYDEDKASISPMDARVEVEPVFEITALTDCYVGTRCDLFLSYKGGGELAVLNKWKKNWTYFDKRNSFVIGDYCSGCAFSFEVNDEAYDCDNLGTSDESDDLIRYGHSLDILSGATGESIAATRTGYNIIVDNNYYPSNSNPERFSYNSINVISLDNEPHVIIMEDVTQRECKTSFRTAFVCIGGEIEEADDEGNVPSTLCNDNVVDSDGQVYCYLNVCNNGDCRRWLRRNARKSIEGSLYVNGDSAGWKMGQLYSWDEVNSGSLCPSGYRVANIDDYNHLLETLDAKASSNHADHLKSNYAWAGGGNGDGAEVYSKFFELFPNGYYSIWDKKYQEVGSSANLWTTNNYQNSEVSAVSINVEANSSEINFRPVVKDAFRLGVRCVCETNCN